ncbi:MAG: DHA2 family efflux MFS transporter permease subunit [Acidimicrobiales bacterium]
MDTAAIVYRRRWWTLVVLCFSLLVIGVDNTILNVALPTLVRDLNATSSQLQWIVDAYTLVFAGLLLTAGSLGDRFGRKGALSLGLLIFGGGSVLSAFSGSAGMLIATRALMGVGGALIMPSTLSILTNTFTNPTERARAIGIWAGVSGMGIAIGPIAGGWLLQHFWWGSVFLVNVPIVATALIAGRFVVTTSKDPSKPRLDPIGAVLSIAGLSALLWGLIEAPTNGWLSAITLGAYGVAAVVLVSFVLWERRSDHPMLDVRVFQNPRFTAASSAITLVFFALFGSFFLMTQYLQDVKGYSSLGAGLRIAPIALILFVAAPASSTFVRWLGSKVVVAGGLVITALGLVVFSVLGVGSGYDLVLLSLLLMGLGMSLTMAPATESIMGSLPRAKAGVGSAVNDTTRQLGGALGVAVLGSVLSSAYASRIAGTVSSVHGLSGSAAATARNSVGGAIDVAGHLGGTVAQTLVTAARGGFVDAMRPAMLVAALVTIVGAGIVVAFLPARATDAAAEPSPAAAAVEAGGAVEVGTIGDELAGEAALVLALATEGPLAPIAAAGLAIMDEGTESIDGGTISQVLTID